MQIATVLFAFVVGIVPGLRSSPTTTATVARLDVSITTSSEWTVVDITPGTVAAQRVVSLPSDVTLRSRPAGWAIASPAGKTRVVRVRAVFEETTRAPTLSVIVSKGKAGTVSVDVRNTSRSSFRAARVVNTTARRVGLLSRAARAVAVRPRYQFFGASNPVIPRADPVRRVLAFYYPWFTPSSYDDPTLADRPLEKFGTTHQPGTLALTRMARSAGIDGFIVSWGGAAANGNAFDNLLDAAVETNGVATVLLETPYANASGRDGDPVDPGVVERWLREALARSSSPAFLRSGGVPVVFVYQMQKLTPAAWQGILGRLGRAVRLVGDAGLAGYAEVEWGRYLYDAATIGLTAQQTFNRVASYQAKLLQPDGAAPHLFAATVSPGFDDQNLRGTLHPIVERGSNGERYLATWDNAFASQPDWILVTSWNEWFEATSIQPSERFGDLALRQTAENAAHFRS